MIGTDEHMAIVITNPKSGCVVHILDLGYAILESREMDRLQFLAESKGLNIYLTTIEEAKTYAQLYVIISELPTHTKQEEEPFLLIPNNTSEAKHE